MIIKNRDYIDYKHDIYKYKTRRPLQIGLSRFGEFPDVTTEYIAIENNVLFLKEDYAWNGASGPTIDTPSSMRASLFHDPIYQLLIEGELPSDCGYRLCGDNLLYCVCLEDGMWRFRAWYWYQGVRYFGGRYSKRK